MSYSDNALLPYTFLRYSDFEHVLLGFLIPRRAAQIVSAITEADKEDLVLDD